jgi:ferric-dicitrate binding protein FerR (iron transport regulator)
MPSRRQRRRRAKESRHEYVWEDAEGNELEPDEVPARKAASEQRSRPARNPREPQAPSWQRTLKRALIFAPVMFVTVMLLSSDQTLSQQITQTAIIVAIFIPFSYLLDGVFWRSYKRRRDRQQGTSSRRES